MTTVDEAREALLRHAHAGYAVVDADEYENEVAAFEAAIRTEYEGPAKRGYDDGMRVARAESHTAEAHDECSAETCEVEALVRSLIARAVSAETKLAALREAAECEHKDAHPQHPDIARCEYRGCTFKWFRAALDATEDADKT